LEKALIKKGPLRTRGLIDHAEFGVPYGGQKEGSAPHLRWEK